MCSPLILVITAFYAPHKSSIQQTFPSIIQNKVPSLLQSISSQASVSAVINVSPTSPVYLKWSASSFSCEQRNKSYSFPLPQDSRVESSASFATAFRVSSEQ